MFDIKGKNIKITHNDFGIILPIKVYNVLQTDWLEFIIYDKENIILSKNFNVDENNILNFILTEEDTKKLNIGKYTYGIKQYRDNKLLDTLTKNNKFTVEKGIGEG